MPREHAPRALRTVAALAVLFGLLGAVNIVGGMIWGSGITLDLSLLGLVVGPGLLRFEARSRSLARIFFGVGAAFGFVFGILFTFADEPLQIKVFARPVGDVHPYWVAGGLLLLAAVQYSAVRVLDRPEIIAKFKADGSTAA